MACGGKRGYVTNCSRAYNWLDVETESEHVAGPCVVRSDIAGGLLSRINTIIKPNWARGT